MVVLFAALPFALTSCGSDDDSDGTDSGIVGTWEITSQDAEFGEVEDGLTLLRFKNDGTYVEVTDEDGDVTIKYGTWTYSDNLLTIDYDGEFQLQLQITSMSSKKIAATIFGGLYTVELTKVKDSKIEAYLGDDSSDSDGQFKVNGTAWAPSSLASPSFSDNYDGSRCYYLSMDFYRKGNSLMYADRLGIRLVPKDYAITVGQDLADQSGFEVEYGENMYQESNGKQPWKDGFYKKKSSGHAYVKKYVKNKSLTIQFSNLKLNYSGAAADNSMNFEYDFSHPSTLTLDGTVTFSYDGD